MTKQEQIEEMVKTIVDREKRYVIGETECKKCNLNKCDLHCNIHSNISYDCEALYNAGYRKADEVRKETAKEIIEWIKGIKHIGSLRCNLIEIAITYGVEVEE